MDFDDRWDYDEYMSDVISIQDEVNQRSTSPLSTPESVLYEVDEELDTSLTRMRQDLAPPVKTG